MVGVTGVLIAAGSTILVGLLRKTGSQQTELSSCLPADSWVCAHQKSRKSWTRAHPDHFLLCSHSTSLELQGGKCLYFHQE